METIKLLIWDLDETFWKGTLSDGEITPVPENIELVKHLTDRGIVNSICSKNDYEKTKAKLEELGVWEYFVFPSIDWTPKGQRIKNIISDMNLRPVNCLFIDDNVNNLEEAKFAADNINVTLPENLPELVKDPAFEGKDDSEHSRLKQYKILEEKAAARAQSGSNEEFLYQSEIHVELIEDCSDKLMRIYEMIHRNNQLNFTKDRISQEEVDRIFTDPEITSGVVHVTDKYGDHGIIGCYAVKDGKALQFVFSCRILGMGVEQWVYAELGYPDIEVVGEVAAELNKTDKPEWINNNTSVQKESVTSSNSTPPRLIVYGTCPLRPVWAYLQPKLPNAKFANFIGPPSICNIAVTARENDEQKKDWLKKFNTLCEYTFDNDIFNENTGYILITLQSEIDNYKYISKSTGSYFFSPKIDLSKESEDIAKEYEESKVTYEDIFEEMSYLCEHLSPNTKVLLQTISEVEFPQKGKDRNYYERIKLNKIAESLAEKFKQIILIDIRKYAKSAADFFDPVANHYNRMIGFAIAKEILNLMDIEKENDSATEKGKNVSDSIPKNARTENIKIKGINSDIGTAVTYIRNGIFYIILNLSEPQKYSIRYTARRNRCIEAVSDITDDNKYSVNVSRPGKWSALIDLFDKNEGYCLGTWVSTVINYNEYNYISFFDAESEHYQEGIGGINQFYNDNAQMNAAFEHMISQIADLASVGCNVADFFFEQDIDEINLFVDKKMGSILLPFLHSANLKIRLVFTTDLNWSILVDGGTVNYYTRDLADGIPLAPGDVLLFQDNTVQFGTFKADFAKRGAKIYTLSYVLSYLMTKKFFCEKCSRIPLILTVRTPNLEPYRGYNINNFTSNERTAMQSLRNNDTALRQAISRYKALPSQYSGIPREELLETLKTPAFKKKKYKEFVFDMEDVKGEYLNIENGIRKTLNQPEDYIGTIYIFGGSHAFGCGVKDSETIASILQKNINLPYKVENYANCWGYDYSSAIRLLENMSFKANDIAVFIMSNWEAPGIQLQSLHWLTWDAIDDPIVKVDTFPLFEKSGRPDYFLNGQAFTAQFNSEIAELVKKEIYNCIKLF